MTTHVQVRRPPAVLRRVGYAMAILINAAMLYAINRWPGWTAVPFLTADTPRVLGWVNASIVAGMATNFAYLANDAPWFKAFGDLITTVVGLCALESIWRVFPIAANDPWPLLARIVLVVAVIGTLIGLAVQTIALARALNHTGG